MSIFPPRNFLMTLMTHDIRDISGCLTLISVVLLQFS